MVPAIGIEPIFLIYHTSIISIILCRHMVGKDRIELSLSALSARCFTSKLLPYNERNLVLTSFAVTQLCYWDHGKSCTYHYLLRRPYGTPYRARTGHLPRERRLS